MKMWTIGLNCTKRRRQASSTTLVSVFSAELTAELTTLILLLNVISCCATCSATSLLPLRNNITICSYVRDTLPHVLEWIEFHRLQGVDKFMLYDDGSTDTTALLGTIYKSHKAGDRSPLVEIFPANPNRRNIPQGPERSDYLEIQLLALNHCNKRCSNSTRWLLMIDVDEFVYSPKLTDTLWGFIERESQVPHFARDQISKDIVSAFYIEPVRYGTSGRNTNINCDIFLDPFTGRWDTSSHEYYTEGRYKFLMDVNPHRAPHPHLDNEYPLQHQAICQTTSFAEYCSHGTGKSIWMPDKCAIAAVHYCENLTFGEMRFVAVTDLRMDHYTFQSEDHIRGLIPLMKEVKGKAFALFDRSWFSLKYDTLITFFSPLITKTLSELFSRQKPMP
ncbi:hypothetical protein RvY_03039-1 [Ramazzottius varieornatus]|uniref:Glycosyltransferase family 92 protein n=1 Tax=Ramazzottius varieornatus TaxID=947166 RepID=A0A1D1UMI7_RAMVA|nr:hypothetical protein RvY_03039-1 [Ramazzottius varieornatus]